MRSSERHNAYWLAAWTAAAAYEQFSYLSGIFYALLFPLFLLLLLAVIRGTYSDTMAKMPLQLCSALIRLPRINIGIVLCSGPDSSRYILATPVLRS